MNWQNIRNRFSALLTCALLLPSCVTRQTGLEVLNTPINTDLEAKVLRQTGVTGAIIGAVVGAGLGYTLARLDAQRRGMNERDANAYALRVAAAAGVAGGGVGWAKGKQTGQKIVSKSMERDYLNKLNEGARAYNNNASQFNTALRKKMNETKSISDPKEKKAMYRALLSQGNKKAGDMDDRISKRQKAVANPNWNSSQKVTLKNELSELTRYRDQLKRTNEELAKAYNSTVPL